MADLILDPNDDLYSPQVNSDTSSNQITDPDASDSANRIKELYQVEQKIIQAIQAAGQALQVLSGDGRLDSRSVSGKQVKFRQYAETYFSLLTEIQRSLHNHTRYLAQSGIISQSAAKSIPFHASVYGEQKELEVWTEAIGVIRARVEEIAKIAKE